MKRKTYLFKPGVKIVHKDTGDTKKIARINIREDVYEFHQEGTRTLERIPQEEVEENYRIYTVADNWLNL